MMIIMINDGEAYKVLKSSGRSFAKKIILQLIRTKWDTEYYESKNTAAQHTRCKQFFPVKNLRANKNCINIFDENFRERRLREALEFFYEWRVQVLEDWRYIAMVIDRLQLYIFLAVTVAGTVSILINAPHIYSYIDQDNVIAGLRDSTNGTLPKWTHTRPPPGPGATKTDSLFNYVNIMPYRPQSIGWSILS